MNLFAYSAYQHSNLKETVRICSIWETFKNMSPLNFTLIDDFKVVIKEVELEYGMQGNSTLIKLLPHLVNQYSKSDKRRQISWFLGLNSLLQVKRYRLTRWGEIKVVEVKKYEIDYPGMSRPTALSVISGHSDFHWMDEK